MYPQMAQAEGFDAGQWQGQQAYDAQQNNAINQRTTLQELYKNQQMLPLEMANKQSSTDLNTANAYHANALGRNSFYDLDAKERLKDPTYQKALSDLATQTSENEVKQAHATLEKDLMSPDPKAQAQAKQRYMLTGDMLKMYEHLRIQGDNAERVARIGAQSRVEAAGMRGSGSGSVKPPATMEAQYNDYFRKSQDPDISDAERATNAQLADTVMKNIIAKGNAKAPAMVIGPNGSVIPNPTTTPGTIVPTPVPGAQPKPQHNMSQLRSMYPGVPDDKLKAAYKAKFGVDL
jgi:hypothetical protein